MNNKLLGAGVGLLVGALGTLGCGSDTPANLYTQLTNNQADAVALLCECFEAVGATSEAECITEFGDEDSATEQACLAEVYATYRTEALPAVECQMDAFDNSTGSQQITTPFLYTPTLQASFEGSTPQGGVLSLEFTTDPAATGPQFAWLWLASFTGPDLNHPVDGWAGLFHHPIALFVLFGAPLPEGQLQYPVPVVPSEAAGVVFRLQGAVSGEGGLEGSLTNTTTFSIPIGP